MYSLKILELLYENINTLKLIDFVKKDNKEIRDINNIEKPINDAINVFNIFEKNKILIIDKDKEIIEEIKNKQEIFKLIILIINELDGYRAENKNILINFFKKDYEKYEGYFLELLSIYRASGRFEFSQKIMDHIVELFDELTKLILENKDYENFEYILIISETFYTKNNNEKTYVIKYMKKQYDILKKNIFG